MSDTRSDLADLPCVAVVLAGGTGSRMGGDEPKQLQRLAGRSVLEHSVTTFAEHPDVDETLLVMHADHAEAARTLLETAGRAVGRVVPGGATRAESTRRALAAIDLDEARVLLHDAARPLVTADVVSRCVDALGRADAVTVAVPVTDTVAAVETSPEGDERLVHVPERTALRAVQTPQGFRLSLIREAHARAAADPEFLPTDDCSVVLRFLPETPVLVVAGDPRNLKVTGPGDLHLAETLLRADAAT